KRGKYRGRTPFGPVPFVLQIKDGSTRLRRVNISGLHCYLRGDEPIRSVTKASSEFCRCTSSTIRREKTIARSWRGSPLGTGGPSKRSTSDAVGRSSPTAAG